jgi:hypothetical protein
VGNMRPSRSSALRHPRVKARIRIGVGVWLLVLAAIACGKGYWWGVLLVAPATLHLYLAYRLLHSAQT